MKTYAVKRVDGSPIWEDIQPAFLDSVLWTENVGVSAQAQLCWDDRALYVRLIAWEKNIRAENRGQLCSVWEDSCLEFFFCPNECNDAYFNIEFNPNTALMLGYGRSQARNRLTLENERELFLPTVERFEGGWGISYQFPVELIQEFAPGLMLQTGKVLHGNFYKCGDKTAKSHYLSWNPIDFKYPNFHCPNQFGALILSD